MLLRLMIGMALIFCPAAQAKDWVLFAADKDEPVEFRQSESKPVAGKDMPSTYKALMFVPEIDPDTNELVVDFRLYRDLGIKGLKLFKPEVTPPPAVPDLYSFMDVIISSGVFSNDEVLQILVVSKIENKEQRDKFILLFMSQAAPEKQAALADFAKTYNIPMPGGN